MARTGRPIDAIHVDATVRWLLDNRPHTHKARRRSLAAALRAASGAPRVSSALVTTLLATVETLMKPDNPTQVNALTGLLAAQVRHALIDTTGSRARLANWDLDF